MFSISQPHERDDELEAAVDQEIAVCNGADLKTAVSHAHVRGRFQTYTG